MPFVINKNAVLEYNTGKIERFKSELCCKMYNRWRQVILMLLFFKKKYQIVVKFTFKQTGVDECLFFHVANESAL